MTPLEFARKLAEEVSTLALPKPAIGQLGDVVADCERSWVTITNVSDRDLFGTPGCGSVEVADIIVIAARTCAFYSDDDGLTDTTKIGQVMDLMGADADLLATWARAHVKASAFGTFGGVTFGNTGDLAIVTVNFSIEVP